MAQPASFFVAVGSRYEACERFWSEGLAQTFYNACIDYYSDPKHPNDFVKLFKEEDGI